MEDARKVVLLARFYGKRMLAYKLESFSDIVGTAIHILLLTYFWTLVGDIESLGEGFNKVGYFVVAGFTTRLTVGHNFVHVGTLSAEVRRGVIVQTMLLPVDIFGHIFAKSIGRKAIIWFVSLVLYVSSLVLVAPSLSVLVQAVVVMIVMLACGYYISKAISSVVFIMVEANSLRFALYFILRIFSGLFIPLVVFPGAIRTLVEYSPISYVAYWSPAIASGIDVNFPRVMMIGVLWIVLLRYFSRWLFNAALARAEVVGL